MSKYFVYVLQSQIDNSWYIGYTENIEDRLIAHNSGKNTSTRIKRPWKVIYYECYLCKQDALGREKFLKSGSGHKYIRKQLRNFLAEFY
jgi:putative endonuclease